LLAMRRKKISVRAATKKEREKRLFGRQHAVKNVKKKKKIAKTVNAVLKPKDLAMLVVEAAQDKKALDIKVMDVSRSSSLADFFVICSGESNPQRRAVCEEIEKKLIPYKVSVLKEGDYNSAWLLLDLGDVIVHIMGKEERDYYRLEDLWEKGSVVYHY
jgi:ribosome-associated protein